MQKLFTAILLLLVIACKKADKQEQKEVSKDTVKVEQKPTTVTETKPNYSKLIQGRWVLPSPKEQFEPWAYYDEKKVYGDGNEEGVKYQIKGDVILYPDTQSEVKILSITEKEMVLQLQEGSKETWIKADLDKEDKTASKNFDSKLLVGLWVLEGGDEFSSIRFKANGNFDMVPFEDFYTYKVDGNKILFKKTKNAPQNANSESTEEILKLDSESLVLKRDGNEFKYKRSKNK
ncbi:MAG: hypothetical protein MUC49_09005 [Raineya sp.]|jgi:hypothetical protein|nr:hypothetical protein [Raineya sp.]